MPVHTKAPWPPLRPGGGFSLSPGEAIEMVTKETDLAKTIGSFRACLLREILDVALVDKLTFVFAEAAIAEWVRAWAQPPVLMLRAPEEEEEA